MDLINIDLAVRVTYHTTGVGRGSQLVVGGFMMDSSTGDLPLNSYNQQLCKVLQGLMNAFTNFVVVHAINTAAATN